MSAETESNKADTETKAEAANASAPEEEAPELEPSPDGPPPPPPIKKRSAPPPAAEEEQPVSVSGRLPAANWPPKTLADLMTRQVITLKEKEPIGDLEGWMKRFRFRHLPVVDDAKKLVGLITLTDLLHGFLGLSVVGAPIEKVNETTLAGSIMRRGVVTADPTTPLATACRVMIHEKLGCLPVVLEDKTLVGIVTETDFVRLSHELLER
ncbi:MAG: CBS domain-containing protein [Polyangiaceae bacterium]